MPTRPFDHGWEPVDLPSASRGSGRILVPSRSASVPW